MKYEFDVKKEISQQVEFIKSWFETRAENSYCVVGTTSDNLLYSLVAAALCKKALGFKRIIEVIMPDGKDETPEEAVAIAQHLNIYYMTASIDKAIDGIFEAIVKDNNVPVSVKAENNMPDRMRSVMAYSVAESLNGEVLDTGYGGAFGLLRYEDWDETTNTYTLEKYTDAQLKLLAIELGIAEEIINMVS